MRLDDFDEALAWQVRVMMYLGRNHRRSWGYYREAGQALLALQADRARPLWARIVKEHCNLSQRRAYELIALARGKPLAQARSEGSARARKHRKSKWLSTKPPRQRRPIR